MTEQDRNKQQVADLLAAVDAGQLEAVLRFYSPLYHDHDASEARRLNTEPLAALRQAFTLFYGAFSGTRHVIQDLIADGDRVAARIWVEAKHTGSIFGFEPSHRLIQNDSIVIYRFEQGLIRERWCRERKTTRSLLEEAQHRLP